MLLLLRLHPGGGAGLRGRLVGTPVLEPPIGPLILALAFLASSAAAEGAQYGPGEGNQRWE